MSHFELLQGKSGLPAIIVVTYFKNYTISKSKTKPKTLYK
jgi:hypothetical protein